MSKPQPASYRRRDGAIVSPSDAVIVQSKLPSTRLLSTAAPKTQSRRQPPEPGSPRCLSNLHRAKGRSRSGRHLGGPRAGSSRRRAPRRQRSSGPLRSATAAQRRAGRRTAGLDRAVAADRPIEVSTSGRIEACNTPAASAADSRSLLTKAPLIRIARCAPSTGGDGAPRCSAKSVSRSRSRRMCARAPTRAGCSASANSAATLICGQARKFSRCRG
jgi:hypothetical protein